MQKQLVSVVIATYNSSATLPLVLDSLKRQSYKSIEIIVIDGGSKDDTLKIARKYNCKIFSNNKVQPTYAKHIGYLRAKGKYVVFLDSDEVLESRESISKKVDCLQRNKNVFAITPSGYKNPKNYPFANEYINEYGDPFSLFIYRLSKSYKYYLKEMVKRYPLVKKSGSYFIFDLSEMKELPIIELAALGSMIDKEFFLDNYPEIKDHPELIWHMFYLLSDKQRFLAIAKDDVVIHYSAFSLLRYLKKINWRIILNVYNKNNLAVAGFSGRDKYQKGYLRLKKYFFIPYVFLLLPVFLDSLYLCFKKRTFKYLFHIPISFYTAILIVYHLLRKKFGLSYNLPAYGT